MKYILGTMERGGNYYTSKLLNWQKYSLIENTIQFFLNLDCYNEYI